MNFLYILQLILICEGSDIGDVGKADEVSRFQISPIALREVNYYLYGDDKREYYTTKMLKENEQAGQEVAFMYLLILYREYNCKTEEKLVRSYNGGPDGHREPSTLDYWHRFKAVKQAYENKGENK